jgi:hypothetical protein
LLWLSAVFMEAANNMEDSSLFMQWAMDTLLQEEEPAVDDVHWAMDTLLQEEEPAAVDDGEAVVFPSLQSLRDASHAAEMVRELMSAAETHDGANSWSSGSGDGGEVTNGGSSGATDHTAPAATDYYGGSWPPQSPNSSFARAPPPPPPSSNSNTSLPTVSWNFVTGSAQPGSEGVLEEAAVPVPARSLPPKLAQRRRSPPTPRRVHPIRSMGAPSSASCTPDHIVAERKRREKINKRLIELSTVIPGLKKVLSHPIQMN